MTATRNGWKAFQFTLANPGDAEFNRNASERFAQYALGWNIYTNRVFDNAAFPAYAESAGLYPKTRPLYNPATRQVDFYASHIYQGPLSTDGANLPDGELLAIPLAKDTPEEIQIALGQLYSWGNWAQKLDLLALYGASMGDVAIEGVENTDKGRVWPQVVPAGFIKDYEQDDRGNIVAYTKEYSFYDRATQQSYKYKKVVTKTLIQEFRNEELFDYGNGAQYENIYGFCPLVMIPHRNMGSGTGAPAIRGWNKVESLCSVASRLDTAIRVKSQSPTMVVGTDLKLKAPEANAVKANDSQIKMLFVEGTGNVISLDGNLDIPGTMQFIDSILRQVEDDNPEVTMYNKMREMTQVTGPALEILMGDVKGYVDRARMSYDGGMARILRMCITMAGVRAQERAGGWSNLSDAQRKFLPFNLDSFDAGNLDFEIISSRPLIKKTKAQYWDDEQKRLQAIQTGINAGEPLEWQEKRAGMSDDEWKEMQRMSKRVQVTKFEDGYANADEIEAVAAR